MFHDREDAGRQLAAILGKRSFKRPLVLAIPRGGVVIGAILAQALGAELDVTLARKLRAPGQPELAFGAISESGHVYVSGDADEGPGVTDEYFHREKERQTAVIESCRQAVRCVRPKASIQGRSVIVADDGIATGSTMMAALQTISSHHPAEIIVAVPVAPQDRIHELEMHCTEVVCPLKVRNFWAVGQYYEDFPNIEDAQVINLLRKFATQPT
jgi:putative phosphoribosyl transferase